MPKDWRSAQTWLQRRAPDRWAEVKDPTAPSSAAFAGINLTINQKDGEKVELALDRPLSELLEAKPELISGTMQFLDQILPVEAVNGVTEHENDLDSAPDVSEATKAAFQAMQYADTAPVAPVGVVLDAEEGSWSEIEQEADTFDR